MQTQKEDIRKKILKVAREEFLEQGFKDTSMRIIAKKAKVGLSNIYNYFKNKDEIFKEVLSGLLEAIDYTFKIHNSTEHIDLYVEHSDDYMRQQIDLFVELIYNHKQEFDLLLFKASGSSLENFRDDYTDKHTEIGKDYIKKLKENYPSINTNISEFFLHTMSSWWMSIVAELVMHDVSHSELETFIKEYMKFGTAGWNKILNINC